MTPLSRFFSRFLPSRCVTVALGIAYALMMFTLLISGSGPEQNNPYIDVRGE